MVAGCLSEEALRRAGYDDTLLLPQVLAFLGCAANSAATAPISPAEPPLDAEKAESFYRRLNSGDEEAWDSAVVGAMMHRAVVDLRQAAASDATTTKLALNGRWLRCAALAVRLEPWRAQRVGLTVYGG